MAKLQLGTKIGNFPYRIVKQIGRGNMAEVYLATVGEVKQGVPPKYVVLKIARTDGDHKTFYHDTLSNEEERLRLLSHQGIVRIQPIQTGTRMPNIAYIGNADLPGRPQFTVLEYLPNGSLEDMLKGSKGLELDVLFGLAIHIAWALDHVHSKQIVHLDLKPENILFRPSGRDGGELYPVLVDFGIARTVGQGGLEARTLHFASPERLSKTSAPEQMPPPHPSMDIWALGVVLYQMATGHRPFEARTDKGLVSAILDTTPTEMSRYRKDLPEILQKVILSALSKDPSQRPTAGELAQRLQEIAIKSKIEPRLPANPNPQFVDTAPSPSRNGFIMPITMITLLALSFGTFPFWRSAVPQIDDGIRWLSVAIERLVPVQGSLLIPEQPTLIALRTETSTPITTSTPIPPMSTPVPIMTSTPVPTLPIPTSTPVSLATPTQTAIAILDTPNDTPSPESTYTPSATPLSIRPTRTPTATRTPTSTPTRFATSTPMVVPTATAVPTSTSTPRVLITSTGGSGTVPPTPPSVPPTAAVSLISPASGSSGGGRQTFAWNANFTPASGQGFELVFWRVGSDPMRNGFGMANPLTSLSIEVNLEAIDQNQGHPLEPGSYQWGVLLVQTTPYQRLKYLGGGWQFTFNR